ncbi:hypothetical protein [Nesterenkonia sp. CL21]|uniref:hypothetical protein n=1 Tax=unclassified Nesterenkonia TaxID=2629769 RepID=UPI00287A5510|nr:hypothetical protein [Nesterenkonia sp. CL21]MDS2172525.1 hypothetical protein [Nesterenkonia sp. CL21]
MDLGLWWSQGRWRPLLELIEKIPQASLLWEARLNDPVEAAKILDQIEHDEATNPGRSQKPRVAIREHDRQSQQMEKLTAAVMSLTNTVRKALKAQPIKYEADQPETLLEQLRWERDVDSAAPLLAAAGFDPDEAMPRI